MNSDKIPKMTDEGRIVLVSKENSAPLVVPNLKHKSIIPIKLAEDVIIAKKSNMTSLTTQYIVVVDEETFAKIDNQEEIEELGLRSVEDMTEEEIRKADAQGRLVLVNKSATGIDVALQNESKTAPKPNFSKVLQKLFLVLWLKF